MIKLSIALIAILTICESKPHYGIFGLRGGKASTRTGKLKADRSGYGYQEMSYDMGGYGGGGGGGGYEPYGAEEYGHDLMSEYGSDYGMEQYSSGDYNMGGYGGGYGDSYDSYGKGGYEMPQYSDYGGGYGGKQSYMPKISYKKSYEMAPMYGKGKGQNYAVKVPNDDSPVKVLFLTQNTPVHIQQKHKKGVPEYKKATTHEEPHVVVHEVIKPVIQEIREVIVPYRKVIQKIEPVKEERKTIVHKKDGKYDDDGDDGGDDDDDKRYKKYKKYGDDDSDGDNDNNNDKKYRRAYKKGNDDGDDDGGDKYKYGRRTGDMMGVEGSDNDQRIQILRQLAGFQQVGQLANGGTMNNGMTLASIFGGQQQQQQQIQEDNNNSRSRSS